MRAASFIRSVACAGSLVGSCTALFAACTSRTPLQIPCEHTLWSNSLWALIPDPTVDPAEGPPLALGGECLGGVPDIRLDDTPECVLIEGVDADPCDCSAPGRKPIDEKHRRLLDEAKARPDFPSSTCHCELVALTGPEGDACRNDASEPPMLNGEPVDGYCLVSRQLGIGNPDVTSSCAKGSPSMLRFAGDLEELRGQSVFVFCASEACSDDGEPE